MGMFPLVLRVTAFNRVIVPPPPVIFPIKDC